MAKRKALLDLGSEGDDNSELKINKSYADKYATWRGKEELQKLKSKYGDGEDDAESSSSEEEDENAEGWSDQLEKDWLRTLAAVKSGDPRIYQKDVKFYHSNDSNDDDESTEESEDLPDKDTEAKKKEVPMHLRDFERNFLLEKGGVLSDSEGGVEEDSDAERKHSPSYTEEQEALKKSIQQAIQKMDDNDGEDCLRPRVKTLAEKTQEEEEYRLWLKGEKSELEHDKQAVVDLAPLKKFWSQPDLDERQKFLRDFILNKAYLNKEDDEELPTYQQLMEELQEDETALEQQEQFEKKYNFRFEEPDSQFLKTYARKVEDSVRRKDNKRAIKHQEIKDRKRKQKQEKQEEIQHLKNLKKKEIMERLQQLKEITGNPDVGFSAKDIEEDFEPAAYDQMMQKHFGEDFYQQEEDKKPKFNDDLDDSFEEENWDSWDVSQSAAKMTGGLESDYDNQPHVDDPDFVMDADYDPSQTTYTSGKKRKHKSKFAQVLETRKPTFDEVCKKYEGSDHPFGDYIDDYFKLDCEDIIAGDIKCRFQYRKTVPNDYGLSVEEILRCPDRELNAWASLKKISQYRTQEDEIYEMKKYKRAKQMKKKFKVLPALKDDSPADAESRGNRKQDNTDPSPGVPQTQSLTKKRKRKLDSRTNTLGTDSVPVKKKHKLGFREKENQVLDRSDTQSQGEDNRMQQEDEKTSDTKVPAPSLKQSVESAMATADKNEKMKGTTAAGDKKSIVQTDLAKHKTMTVHRASNAGGKAKKMRKKKKVYQPDHASSDRLKAYDIDPRKFKYTKHQKLKKSAM